MAQRADIDAVVAGGGDGTALTAILAGLGDTKPLGILPLGTLNLLARDLELPLDPIEAAVRLAKGHTASIDLAEVNGLPFAIWASLGMHPSGGSPARQAAARRAEEIAGLRPGGFTRLPPLSAGPGHPVGGRRTDYGDHPLLVISNNAWPEQTLPLKRAALDRGELAGACGEGQLPAGPAVAGGHCAFWLLADWTPADTYKADEVRVTSRKRRMMVSLDGEVTVLRSPLVFRLAAQGADRADAPFRTGGLTRACARPSVRSAFRPHRRQSSGSFAGRSGPAPADVSSFPAI